MLLVCPLRIVLTSSTTQFLSLIINFEIPNREPLLSIQNHLWYFVNMTKKEIESVLRTLLHRHLQISTTLSTLVVNRDNSLSHISTVRFPLGAKVQHNLFDYRYYFPPRFLNHLFEFKLYSILHFILHLIRGIVVKWDPRPAVDVKNCDGLKHIKNPSKCHFYHVLPQRDDCLRVFGGERHIMYVCQENLVEIPAEDDFVVQDLENWFGDGGSIVPDTLKVRGCHSYHINTSRLVAVRACR